MLTDDETEVADPGEVRFGMQLTVLFTDVYEGAEYPRTESFDVPEPSVDDDDLTDWADEHLYPRTGSGRPDGEAGYWAEITACPDRPELVGREFDWGT